MALVLENIDVSLQVEEKLKNVAEKKGDGIDYMYVALQCIDVIHLLNSHWRESRHVYKEDKPLKFPAPAALAHPPFHEIRLRIYPEQARSLAEICGRYRIDKQSAIFWALECMDIIDNTLMNNRIFSGLTDPPEQLTVGWLHKKVGS